MCSINANTCAATQTLCDNLAASLVIVVVVVVAVVVVAVVVAVAVVIDVVVALVVDVFSQAYVGENQFISFVSVGGQRESSLSPVDVYNCIDRV
jgi:hypothetical protein